MNWKESGLSPEDQALLDSKETTLLMIDGRVSEQGGAWCGLIINHADGKYEGKVGSFKADQLFPGDEAWSMATTAWTILAKDIPADAGVVFVFSRYERTLDYIARDLTAPPDIRFVLMTCASFGPEVDGVIRDNLDKELA